MKERIRIVKENYGEDGSCNIKIAREFVADDGQVFHKEGAETSKIFSIFKKIEEPKLKDKETGKLKAAPAKLLKNGKFDLPNILSFEAGELKRIEEKKGKDANAQILLKFEGKHILDKNQILFYEKSEVEDQEGFIADVNEFIGKDKEEAADRILANLISVYNQ